MSLVCAKCFQDRTARNFIKNHGESGNCDFCNSRNCRVLQAGRLRDIFGELVGLCEPYEPAPYSESWGDETLAECLSDWEIFSEDMDLAAQNNLLDEIMDFDPRDGSVSAREAWQMREDHWAAIPIDRRWPWFADYLKTQRRFIIEDDPTGEIVSPKYWVPDLVEKASAIRRITPNTRLFRGRLGKRSTKEMGAPPASLATAGRANPAGISFLYCAFNAETAIIETGRFPGAKVSLRELRPRRQLRLADLRGRTSALEPLATPNLAEEIRKRTLLCSLGRALGAPIHPEDSEVEYVPTQYLAEVIRSAGYDGICYPSALNETGTNVVIFDPNAVRISSRGGDFELGLAQYTVYPNPGHCMRSRIETS